MFNYSTNTNISVLELLNTENPVLKKDTGFKGLSSIEYTHTLFFVSELPTLSTRGICAARLPTTRVSFAGTSTVWLSTNTWTTTASNADYESTTGIWASTRRRHE
jgi:hypothetical protein